MLNEADTRAKLIDPAIYRCGWSEKHFSREVKEVTEALAKLRALG